MAQKLKLYIGCSLTHAPEEFKVSIEALQTKLKTQFEVLEFVPLAQGNPTIVYQNDIKNCVPSCDLFVAVCDYPSTGLGYELGTAIEKLHKPVLAVAHTDTHITRLVIGIEAPGFEFKRYKDISEVYDMILDRAKEIAV